MPRHLGRRVVPVSAATAAAEGDDGEGAGGGDDGRVFAVVAVARAAAADDHLVFAAGEMHRPAMDEPARAAAGRARESARAAAAHEQHLGVEGTPDDERAGSAEFVDRPIDFGFLVAPRRHGSAVGRRADAVGGRFAGLGRNEEKNDDASSASGTLGPVPGGVPTAAAAAAAAAVEPVGRVPDRTVAQTGADAAAAETAGAAVLEVGTAHAAAAAVAVGNRLSGDVRNEARTAGAGVFVVAVLVLPVVVVSSQVQDLRIAARPGRPGASSAAAATDFALAVVGRVPTLETSVRARIGPDERA